MAGPAAAPAGVLAAAAAPLAPLAAEEVPGGAGGAGGRGKARGSGDGKLVEATVAGAAALVAFLKRAGGSGKAGKAVFAAVAGAVAGAGATVAAGTTEAALSGAPGAAGAAGACPKSRPAVMAATTARWMGRVFTIGYFLVGALVPVTRDEAAALVEDLGLPVEPDPGAVEAPPGGLDPTGRFSAVAGLTPVAALADDEPAGAAALGFFWKLATKVTEALRFWPLLSSLSRLMSRTRIIESLAPKA